MGARRGSDVPSDGARDMVVAMLGLGMTKGEIAEECGLHVNTIYRIMRGAPINARTHNLVRYAWNLKSIEVNHADDGVREMIHLIKLARGHITRQQILTLRGQALSGDTEGARKGLLKILKRRVSK